jgi:hypothetical protein
MPDSKWVCFVCGNESPAALDRCPVDGNLNPDPLEAPVQPPPAPKRKSKKPAQEES